MLYFFIGFVAGLLIASAVLVTWILRAKAGEIQIYDYEGVIYPVMAVKSKKDFDKRYLLLKTKRYD